MNRSQLGKVVIFSAPSGAGKSTLIAHLKKQQVPFVFSVSATSRAPRGEEKEGVDYYFLSEAAFRQKVSEGAFLEYEEVYPGRFYGTLRSEVDAKLEKGAHLVLDIDVEGALNVKRIYADRALALFIMPPSLEVLRQRLTHRGTDAPELIEQRLSKAKWEMDHAPSFDRIVVNDDLERACQEVEALVRQFLES